MQKAAYERTAGAGGLAHKSYMSRANMETYGEGIASFSPTYRIRSSWLYESWADQWVKCIAELATSPHALAYAVFGSRRIVAATLDRPFSRAVHC